MSNNINVYIDESGDVNLGKNGSDFFIVSAVIVSQDKVEDVKGDAERLKKYYFQTGEIKSSTIGSNDTRRAKILKAFGELDFTVIILQIDKSRVKKK